jgi:hypothetical protein
VTRPPVTSFKPEKEIAGISVFEIFHIKIARFFDTVKFLAVQIVHFILIAVDAEIWNCYNPSTCVAFESRDHRSVWRD